MDAAKKMPKAIILFPVFIPAVIVTLLLVIGTISNPELAGEVFSSTLAFITTNFGWFYMLSVAFFLVFIVGIAMTPWGSIKLGPDHAEPQYSFPAWFAMLFSAGYGIALLFFGVAEPVMHFSTPPVGDPGTVAAAREAMKITFFHWGLHAWAIYAIVALILAYVVSFADPEAQLHESRFVWLFWVNVAVAALLDAQELDSRQSTGTVYWEGLSDLFDVQGQPVGRGYLEMTGYAQRLVL